jgi:hypothetical protein
MTLHRAALVALPLALLAAACSPPQGKANPPEVSPPTAPPAAATPAASASPGDPVEQASWNGWQDAEAAGLTYAIPESDDAGPTLHCDLNAGKVEVIFFVDHRESQEVGAGEKPARFTLASGTVTRTYDGTIVGEEMMGGSEVHGTLAMDDPVLVSFARTGQISFSAYGENNAPPMAGAADVAKFLAACRKV